MRKVDYLIRLANICCRRPVVAPRLWRALRRRQQQYNRQVTAYTVRVQDRHKRASKPRSSVDATLLMEQLQRTNTTLKHILDSMHYHVCPQALYMLSSCVTPLTRIRSSNCPRYRVVAMPMTMALSPPIRSRPVRWGVGLWGRRTQNELGLGGI